MVVKVTLQKISTFTVCLTIPRGLLVDRRAVRLQAMTIIAML